MTNPDPGTSTPTVDLSRLRYQSFEFDGQRTRGHDRSYIEKIAFGDSIEGATVLDIGSYLGYFCVKALKGRALAATGIEPHAESVAQAEAIAQKLGVQPRYLNGDFEEWDFSGERFDVVLCLNVLHHMFDAIAAINKMKRLAKRKIVIEFAAPNIRDVISGEVGPIHLLTNWIPAIVLGNPRKNVDIAKRSFLFTGKAMRVLFDKHSCEFEPVTITKSPFKGRLILEANKRNLGEVAFVVGPTASGKSTCFAKLMQDASYRQSCGLSVEPWHGVLGHEISLPNGRVDRALVHYDLLRPHGRSIRAYNRDPRCDLLDVAERATFVTLMVEPSQLRKQLLSANKVTDPSRLSKRHSELYRLYADPSFLRGWYQAWFSYIDRHAKKMTTNVILLRRQDGSESIVPAQNWKSYFTELYGS